MSAIVICMASAKGGSGKTTITSAFAAFLQEIGKKVLVIDCDEATHGMTLLYLDQVNMSAERDADGHSPFLGIFDSGYYPRSNKKNDSNVDPLFELEALLRKDQEGSSEKKFLYVPVENGFYLLPATYYFSMKPQMEPKAFLERIRWILSQAREKYDYIFLDAQAGSDVVSQICVRRDVSDQVVIVSEYDPLSAAGVERLKGMMSEDLNFSRTWILLNKMLPEFVKSFSEFLSVARYLPPVPWTADVVRAYSRRRLAVDFENGNAYTLGILQTLKTLIPHTDAILLEAWTRDKAAIIRQPLDDQYSDAEKKLEYISYEIAQLEHRDNTKRFLSLSAPVVFIIASLEVLVLLIGNDIDRISYIIGNSPAMWAILGSIILILVLYILFMYTVGSVTNATKRIRKDSLERQRTSAEEELRRLDSLRTADIAELVNSKANRQYGNASPKASDSNMGPVPE